MREIPIYRRSEITEHVALVDDSDFAIVSVHRWGLLQPKGSKTAYARAFIGGKVEYLHRYLMNAKSGQEIDHIDGNGLNNTKANLRFVTRSENIRAAHRLLGRYGNPTNEDLDAELAEFEAELERQTNS